MRKKRRVQSTNFSINLTGKHVFGAYFNMARTNFVKTINYILPIAGVRGNYSESQINKMLHALFLIHAGRSSELSVEQSNWKKRLTLNVEQQARLQRLLFKHFPVLQPMMADAAEHKAYLAKNKKKSDVQTDDDIFAQFKGVSLAECLNVVALMADTLTECRNFYTHKDPYNTPEQLEKQYEHQEFIALKLDKVVVASRRVLKDREGLTVGEVEFLTGIDHMKQVDKKDENGNVIYVEDRGTRKKAKAFVEYDDFYFKITGSRTAGGKACSALSDFGLLYFCILFLSKPYAKLFIDESRLFEFSPFDENENLIMQEMLSIYRIRTPRLHRIDSRDNKAALAMDIFGEMRRCPIELYDLLDKEHGQPFFHDEVKHPNSHTPEVSKRLRLNDRFPHLALRYIDEMELFKRVRFQLQMGAFRYKFYGKECIDGRVRVRRIQKDINGYGRLQDVADKRMERWDDLIQKREERPVKLEHEELYIDLDQFTQDSADSTPYVTDRRPAYNIHANRIGMFWEESQNPQEFKFFDKNGMYIPVLSVTDDHKAPIAMPAPRCTLSVHDLPAMLFYEYLLSQLDQEARKQYHSAEQIIIGIEADYRKFFGAVADGNIKPFASSEKFADYLEENYPSMLLSDIPQKIRQYLSSEHLSYEGKPVTVRERLVEVTLKHLAERMERLERRLKNYTEDLKKIGNKDNKIGKKDFADVRHGALARYLVQDMMEWQPSKDGKGADKLTGLNYNVLTAFLATYGTPQASLADSDIAKLSLKEVLRNAHLVGGDNPHPFLEEVLAYDNKNIEDFYLNYLTEEVNHLNSRIQSLSSNPTYKALESLPFVHHNRIRYNERTDEEIRALAGRYATIQLPDGLFIPNIVDLLENQYATNTDMQKALSFEGADHLNPTRNATYLISQFYKTVLHDNAQPFYQSDKSYTRQQDGQPPVTFSFRRAYDLFTELNNDKEDYFPFELKPLFLTSEEIQQRLTEKRLGKDGNPIPQRENGEIKKDAQGNIIWERKITHDIDFFVNTLSNKDLKCSKNEVKEKRDAKREKMKRMVHEIKNNERTIRRYRTQDMILFLLAKKMFVDLLGEQSRSVDWKQLRLSKVCNDAFLRQTLTFRVPVTVGDKTVYVEQENMSLKNYGEFYRFLTDDRLTSLFENIVDSIEPDKKTGERVVSHTDLMSELAAYDQRRSTVFRLIQQIEDIVISGNAILANPDCDIFWVDGKRGELAKRNNFASLLKMIDLINTTSLTDDERTLLVAIRNAFGHNSYRVDLKKIGGINHLPEVANSILKHLETLSGFSAE